MISYEKKVTLLPAHKETKHEKYNRSEKGRKRYAKYRASSKGILTRLREDSKRIRLRLIELEEEFECIKRQISRCSD